MGFSTLSTSGGLRVTARTTVITTTSTGTQNDFAPGLIGDTLVRCNNATLLTINGLSSGVDGQRVTFVSIGTGQVDFAHQAGGSTAGNRLINNVTSMVTSLFAGKGYATYQYDGATARWRLVNHEQGGMIAYTTTWAGFTSNPAIGNGTLSAKYLLRGSQVVVAINVTMGSTTTFGVGFWTFTTPAAPSASALNSVTSGFALDVSAGAKFSLLVSYTASGGTGLFATTAAGVNIDANNPMVWATSDVLWIAYEFWVD